jgi:hypothetical protein
MITVSSNNQTIGVILLFMRHPLIGFVCGQTDMHTVYNNRGSKASVLTVPDTMMRPSPALNQRIRRMIALRRDGYRISADAAGSNGFVRTASE